MTKYPCLSLCSSVLYDVSFITKEFFDYNVNTNNVPSTSIRKALPLYTVESKIKSE